MRRILLFLFFYCLIFSPVVSQKLKTTRDFQAWASVGLERNLLPRLELKIEKEIRFEKDVSEIDNHFTCIGLSYKLNKYIEFGSDLRFIWNNKKDKIYENKYRYDIDLTLKYKIDRIKFDNRVRFENNDEDFFRNDEVYESEQVFRDRLEIKYNFENFFLTPYISGEIFYVKDGYIEPYFNKFRTTIGTRFILKNEHKFKLFYMIENELGSDYPYTYYIAGLSYILKI